MAAHHEGGGITRVDEVEIFVDGGGGNDACLAAHTLLHGDDVRHDDHVRTGGPGARCPGDEGVAAAARISGHVARDVGIAQEHIGALAVLQLFMEERIKLCQRFFGDLLLVFGNEAGEKLRRLRGLSEGRHGHDEIGHDEALLLGGLLAAGQKAEAAQGKEEMAEEHQSRLPLVLGMRSLLRRTACASARPSPLAADSRR